MHPATRASMLTAAEYEYRNTRYRGHGDVCYLREPEMKTLHTTFFRLSLSFSSLQLPLDGILLIQHILMQIEYN